MRDLITDFIGAVCVVALPFAFLWAAYIMGAAG
jgi:hypothetical protein